LIPDKNLKDRLPVYEYLITVNATNAQGETQTKTYTIKASDIDLIIDVNENYKNVSIDSLKHICFNVKNLKENPDETIGDSNMTYAQAKEYFKHYIEGTDFTDGIDEKDITRTGARENFAESYSTIFDSSPSEVNDIYSDLFGHSIEAVRQFFVA
jgi:hypothetical protein